MKGSVSISSSCIYLYASVVVVLIQNLNEDKK